MMNANCCSSVNWREMAKCITTTVWITRRRWRIWINCVRMTNSASLKRFAWQLLTSILKMLKFNTLSNEVSVLTNIFTRLLRSLGQCNCGHNQHYSNADGDHKMISRSLTSPSSINKMQSAFSLLPASFYSCDKTDKQSWWQMHRSVRRSQVAYSP